ncbi:MAG: response regulator [Pseudomonadota bacterium]
MLFVPQRTRLTADQSNKHRHVLICDPNREMCKTIARIVNNLGYQAVAATDGSAALRLCERQKPDLILVDENMPGAKAMDFLDAGLGHLLTRRALMIERRTAHRPRWLPTVEKPMEVSGMTRQLSRLLCDS